MYFFVTEKDGSLRLIFDTRLINLMFHTPPSTRLPSAAAFSQTECRGDKPLYFASGDLANAFYTLGLPPGLAELFTLPAIAAAEIGVDNLSGIPVEGSTPLLPFLTVLPMGWSWALHLWQLVMNHAITATGISAQFQIADSSCWLR